MPRPGLNSTWHRKTKGGWEYWQFPFSRTVLIAELKHLRYNPEYFKELRAYLKTKGYRMFWNENDMKKNHNGKTEAAVELYKKFPDGVLFSEKVAEFERFISKINFERR